jgi:drug/metabolite transporter (DMT)-like permease
VDGSPELTRRGDVARLVVAALAFATSSPLARLAGGLPPVAVAAMRTAIASACLLTVAPETTLRALAAMNGRQRLGMVGAGAVLAAHFALFLGGLASTSFSAAVGLLSLEPLAVVLAAWAAFGMRPVLGEWVGLFVAIAGTLVVTSGAGTGEHRLAGDAMVLGAVVLYGVYVAAARGLRDALPAGPYAAVVYAVSAVVLVPFAVPAVLGIAPPAPTTWVAVVLLGLVPTLVGHTLVQRAARTAPPAMVALTSPGETVGSLAIGALFLGRSPSPVEALGALLVVSGAVVAIMGMPSRGGGRG